MKFKNNIIALCCLFAFVIGVTPVNAAGPLAIFDPPSRTPYAWGAPVAFYTDNDPMFSLTGPVSNADADARVADGVAEWTNVPTSTFSGFVAGDFASIGIPDINIFNIFSVLGVFNGGGYHVVYDHDGVITANLAGPGVLGFSGPEWVAGPTIVESFAVLNGATVAAGDGTGSEWQGVFTHEFGHGINLAHTQTNGAIAFFGDARGPTGCPIPYPPGLTINDIETMYPFLDVRVGIGSGVEQGTVDLPDDQMSLSDIYPAAGWPGNFTTITGKILRFDGITEVTGVNVIARNIANPFRDCTSQLSGAFTQGAIGNDGLYTLNGLTPGADYVVYVDGIVAGGFSTPPIVPLPGPEEYYNGANESADPNVDDICVATTISGAAGAVLTADVIFNFQLNLGDDDFEEVPLPFTFRFCGKDYTTVFVNSNGSVSFGAGSTTFFESVAGLISGPARIAPLWDDLNPAAGGSVTVQQVGADFVISWIGVPEFFATGSNTFSVTLRPDNSFRMDYGAMTALDGLTGTSPNIGAFTVDPGPIDVSSAPQPITGAANSIVYEQFFGGFDLANQGFEWAACPDVNIVFAPAQRGNCYASTGVGDGGRLMTVNINSGAATPIGATGFSRVPGLAINSSGEIYGSSGGGGSQLLRIDGVTGLALSLGTINIGGSALSFIDALAFDENDVLYGIDVLNNLVTIDVANGNATLVGNTGVTAAPFLVGLAFDPDTGRLFCSSGGLGSADAIYEINPGSGVATFIGNTGLGGGAIPDLHFLNGTLYGSKSAGGGVFNLITINTSNGSGAVVGPFGVTAVSGLAGHPPIELALDIKPRSCPNPLKFNNNDNGSGSLETKGGVLPVAILGTDEFDVNDIDVSTVLLEGVAPLLSDLEDVTTPAGNPSDCACTTAGPDGETDLTLKFQKKDITAVLPPLQDGDVIALTMTGNLLNGDPFVATDCVRIILKDGKPAMAQTAGGDAGLAPASPNPFNPVTRISYTIPAKQFVQLTVYDVKGVKVDRLVARVQEAGEYVVEWNASSVPSGVYFYRLEAGNFNETRKMVLLK